MSFFNLVISLIVLGVGLALGYFLRRYLVQKKMGSLELTVHDRLEKAQEEAKQIILQAKDKAVSLLASAEENLKKEKDQLNRTQERLLQKEVGLEDRAKKLETKEEKLLEQAEKIKAIKTELEAAQEKEFERLEQLSQLTRDQAQQELFNRLEQVHHQDLLESLRKLEKERGQEIEKRASEMVSTVIQRYSRPMVSEITTSIVNLPSEEIKGRIIGKEGRNIKHFEKLTGVEAMIDETPDSIMLSCFDPVRREVGRVALERLIQDGRIQPARIEEQIEEAKKIVSQTIKDAGEEAVYEVGIIDFPAEIVHLIGRLKFRTSYGQNVLNHSIEVATLSRMLAEELGLDADIAKKAGLVHDIGKAVDHEIEGDHLELGIKILQKYKVDEKVTLAMRSHHEDYPIAIAEAYVVNAADAISGARPGARRDALEEYLKRLGDLERIANGFPGVEKSYAIQSGRELRVFVTPNQLDDYSCAQLARNISERISQELKFPGEIRVVVIRETRAIEYAR
jgi:ribonuclease Y